LPFVGTETIGKEIELKRQEPLATYAGWALALLGSALLIAWMVTMAQAAQSLRGHLSETMTLADAPSPFDPQAACDLMGGLRDDVVRLRRGAGWLARLGPALGWVPRFGGDLRAAPDLLAVADGLSEAGTVACQALEPALAAFGGDADFSLETAVDLLAASQPEMTHALEATERAHAAWTRIDTGALSPWLVEKIAPLERGLPLLRSGLSAATVAPDLLGVDAPRTYLVLALNEDEQRAVGGYITGVGEVVIAGGHVTSMAFRDGYAVDDFTQPYPDAPEPLQRYMGIDLWVFRDSNWSPDFPTVARQAIDLYRPGYPVTIDGVIALDQEAVRAIVAALEPLAVEGVEEPVTGATIVGLMRSAWAPEGEEMDADWWINRKEFIGDIAAAALRRLQEGQVYWIGLGRALLYLLEEKHLLVYAGHPGAAAILATPGWDGALRPAGGDFLMITDTNMGYNRASARIRQAVDYRVDLGATAPEATLTLVYTHTGTVDTPCVPEVRYDPVYTQMMERCYWDYLRVYVPRGSRLLDATRIPVPGEMLLSGEAESGEVALYPADEGPWDVFAVMGVMPPSSQQTRQFIYALPQEVESWDGDEGEFTLRVQKQPGSAGSPLTVRVRLPEGTSLLDATPEPTTTADGWLIFRTTLAQDRSFSVRFRR
jgi:hypothetical protein